MTSSALPARPNPLRPATILNVKYRLLGPLEVDGVVISSPQARRLLALFLVHRNSVVSVDRIVDTLWDGNPPPAATNAALSKISRLRAFLPPGALTRAGDGYRLKVADDACDAVEFDQLVEKARNASEVPTVRIADLQRALGLFRGPALGDLAHIDAIRPSAVKLDRLREEAEELRLECLLTIGDAHAVLAASDASSPTGPSVSGSYEADSWRCGHWGVGSKPSESSTTFGPAWPTKPVWRSALSSAPSSRCVFGAARSCVIAGPPGSGRRA